LDVISKRRQLDENDLYVVRQPPPVHNLVFFIQQRNHAVIGVQVNPTV
jgi:hypothetical protein